MKITIKLLVLGLVLGACSANHARSTGAPTPAATVPGTPSASASGERPVAAESNPPGDIPDNQAFVIYRAAGGFELKVPEGWAQTSGSQRATFADKLNSIEATWQAAQDPPTPQRARSKDVPHLRASQRAFELRGITTERLPAGDAVLITYRANSAPNDVTGRQYRLDVLRFEFFRGGKEVDLTLSSPVGADNVDPWHVVSRSFVWR